MKVPAFLSLLIGSVRFAGRSGGLAKRFTGAFPAFFGVFRRAPRSSACPASCPKACPQGPGRTHKRQRYEFSVFRSMRLKALQTRRPSSNTPTILPYPGQDVLKGCNRACAGQTARNPYVPANRAYRYCLPIIRTMAQKKKPQAGLPDEDGPRGRARPAWLNRQPGRDPAARPETGMARDGPKPGQPRFSRKSNRNREGLKLPLPAFRKRKRAAPLKAFYVQSWHTPARQRQRHDRLEDLPGAITAGSEDEDEGVKGDPELGRYSRNNLCHNRL